MIANDDDLIERIMRRASKPQTRTDYPTNAVAALPPRATAETINKAEADLGFKLPALVARLYGEVANGGFGPGFGIIGLTGG